MNSHSIQVMLLKQTIDSLVNLDHGLADAVSQGDDDVDDLLSSMYCLTEYRINTDPKDRGASWLIYDQPLLRWQDGHVLVTVAP